MKYFLAFLVFAFLAQTALAPPRFDFRDRDDDEKKESGEPAPAQPEPPRSPPAPASPAPAAPRPDESAQKPPEPKPKPKSPPTVTSPRLSQVAISPYQWTGVTVSERGRIFVNFPRWSDYIPMSVAQILRDGSMVPYPGKEWNNYNEASNPSKHFVCVQSVFVDAEDFLWVLDTGNPRFEGVILGGPKLVRIDLTRDEVTQVIPFDLTIAPENSYLNDVRVDTLRNVAYITDSGVGALIVVDLHTGKARRLLEGHDSTTGDQEPVTIEGAVWKRDGEIPNIHADGIALSPDRAWLYFMPLSERHLYRVETRHLRDENLSPAQLATVVEKVAEPGPCDGIAFGPDGRLYLTTLETPSLDVYDPVTGTVSEAVRDTRLAWPDTLAAGPNGALVYVTTSQIHRGPNPGQPYRLLALEPPEDTE